MTTALVTGIDGALAGLVAGVLAAQPHMRVIGVGRAAPERALDDVDVHVCDMRGDTLLALMRAVSVDVVAHLDLAGEEWPVSREAAGRGNVYRTIEVLGACQAAGVPRVVLRSSLMVYGARPDRPAFVAETAPLSSGEPAGLLQDYVEIERVAADFSARHSSMRFTILRCAGVAGGRIGSPLARFLVRRPAPMIAGFDPRIQVLHAYDAAVAIALAVLNDRIDGPLNIAADPPLLLSQAIHFAGGSALPLPAFAFSAAPLFEPLGSLVGELPFAVDYLRYACVGDTRRAVHELQWETQHSPEETLRELAA